jgi:hypothetical protein
MRTLGMIAVNGLANALPRDRSSDRDASHHPRSGFLPLATRSNLAVIGAGASASQLLQNLLSQGGAKLFASESASRR